MKILGQMYYNEIVNTDIDEIIDKYYRKVYKLCLFYLKDKEEAEEVLQEIFIKIFKKSSTFEGKAGIYTWIYRIAVNTLINYINRKRIVAFISFARIKSAAAPPHAPDAPGENIFAGWGQDPAVKLEKEEIERLQLERLEVCLGQLSQREKTAFYFFHYDQLKQKEIAAVMGTSLSAVESLLHKAMKKLRRCVKPDNGSKKKNSY